MSFLKRASEKEEYSISLRALCGEQFGNNVYSAQAVVADILTVFEVDQSVQRDLSSEQVASISQYIIGKLKENHQVIYFPPFVFSARGHGKYIEEELKYKLKVNNKIAVLDGQHRLRALESVASRLKNSTEPAEQQLYEKLMNVPLSFQIYESLTIDEEQQLFTDVNAKNARVGANLIKYYDDVNITSKLMREILHHHPKIQPQSFETRKNETRKKLMTGLVVYKIIAALHNGKEISNQVNYNFEEEEYDELLAKTSNFLTLLVQYMPKNAYDRAESIYLNQSVLIGIAQVSRKIKTSNQEKFFKEVIRNYDWSHKNKDLHRMRIPFNRQTNRFRLSPGSRVIKTINRVLTTNAMKRGYIDA